MIIQKVLKGIASISEPDARAVMEGGIQCNWWRKVGLLPVEEIPHRLTDRNLHWHQNRYTDLDPLEGNEEFRKHTPFISVTAGTVERDVAARTNVVHFANEIALGFATNFGCTSGWVFHCYVFILGRKAISHAGFAEEVRELNIYTGFSPYQPEGEITAKIEIPPAQIEQCEEFDLAVVKKDLAAGRLPTPVQNIKNPLYQRPENISNIRDML